MCTYQVVLQTQSRPSLLDTTVITAGTAKGFVRRVRRAIVATGDNIKYAGVDAGVKEQEGVEGRTFWHVKLDY